MNSRCKKRRNNEFGWRECQAKACLGQECRNCSVIFRQEHHDPAFIVTARGLYWPSTLQKERGGFRCIIFLQVCVKCQSHHYFLLFLSYLSPLPLLPFPLLPSLSSFPVCVTWPQDYQEAKSSASFSGCSLHHGWKLSQEVVQKPPVLGDPSAWWAQFGWGEFQSKPALALASLCTTLWSIRKHIRGMFNSFC